MRTIKFRGYEKSSGLWRYGLLLVDGEKYYIAQIIQGKLVKWLVAPNSIGQFTGLQDSKGNDIYEGDILKDKDWEVFEDKKSFVVSFDEISPRFLLGRTDGRSSIFQLDATFANRSVIIANIHDNPELLKGGEKWL